MSATKEGAKRIVLNLNQYMPHSEGNRTGAVTPPIYDVMNETPTGLHQAITETYLEGTCPCSNSSKCHSYSVRTDLTPIAFQLNNL